MHRLTCFGGLRFEVASEATAGSSAHPKRLALLALLAASGERGVSRDRALALLWPESDAERARNALKQMVHAIRTELGPAIDSPPHGHLRLDPNVIGADVADFRAALERGDFEAAVYLHTGPFLDGFYLRDALEFERWVDEERKRLADAYADALEQLARGAQSKNDAAAAVRWWKRRADADPLSARVAREYVSAIAATGDREAALRQAKLYETLVRNELGVEPDASVTALATRPHKPQTIPVDVEPIREPVAPSPVTRRRKPLMLGVAGLAFVALVTVVLTATRASQTLLSKGQLTSSDRIVVGHFTVRGTTDSTLGFLVSDALTSDLRQSNAFGVVGSDQIAGALRRMGKPVGTVVHDSIAREIALRDGLKAFVSGTVAHLSDGFVLTARLVSADSAMELASARSVAKGATDLLPAIEQLSHQLRAQIGESLRRVRASPALAEVTTPSFEALRKFSEGARAWNFQFDRSKAIALLEEAASIDTGFAVAWRLLSVIYDAGRQPDRSAAALRHAFANLHRASERERLVIEADYYVFGPGYDRARGAAALERFSRHYPDMRSSQGNLGNLYQTRRQFAKAESVYRATISPDNRVIHVGLSRALASQGNIAGAESVTVLMQQRFASAAVDVALQWGWLLYLKGDLDSSIAVQPVSSPDPPRRALALSNRSGLERLRGRLGISARYRAEWDALVRTIPGAHDPLAAALDSVVVALYYLREPASAVAIMNRGLRAPWDSIPKGLRQPLRIARLYAQAGDAARARHFIRRWEEDLGADTAQRRYLDWQQRRAMADVLSAEGEHDEALASYRAGLLQPDGPVDACIPCEEVDLARLFDAAGQPDSALVYYHRYLTGTNATRFLVDRDYLPLALLRVGDLHYERMSRDSAHRAYTRLASLWRNADPALRPTLDRVHARLRGIEREGARSRQ
jgi:DNA-binding SARP family transcriptional activator